MTQYKEEYKPELEYFKHMVNQHFNDAIKFISGAKLYGYDIDVTDLEEVVAALYIAYSLKGFMVKPESEKSDA